MDSDEEVEIIEPNQVPVLKGQASVADFDVWAIARDHTIPEGPAKELCREMICMICLAQVACVPFSGCSHHTCVVCMQELKRRSGNQYVECHLCRQVSFKGRIILISEEPQNNFERIRQLRMKHNKKRFEDVVGLHCLGTCPCCGQRNILMKDMLNHLRGCGRRRIICENDQCNDVILLKDQERHMNETCEWVACTTPGCSVSYHRRDRVMHLNGETVTPCVKINCPFTCSRMFEAGDGLLINPMFYPGKVHTTQEECSTYQAAKKKRTVSAIRF